MTERFLKSLMFRDVFCSLANLKKWIDNFKSFLVERGVKYNTEYRTALFHNESNFNLWKYLNKKNYYAKGFSVYIDKWGRDDIVIKKQFGIAYWYFGVFIENGKWKKLIAHPVLVLYTCICLRLAYAWS